MNLLSILVLCSGLAGERPLAAVTLLDGQRLEGVVTAWTDQGLSIQTGDGPREVLAEQLLSAHWPNKGRETPSGADDSSLFLELVDGTRVVCQQFAVAGEHATIHLPLTGGMQSLDRTSIRRVELPPRVAGVEDIWRELDQKDDVVGDVLIIKKKAAADDVPTLDYLTGVVKDVTDEKVDFVWDGDLVPIKRSKVAALGFFRARDESDQESVIAVRTVDGSNLVARRVQMEEGFLSIESPAGLQLKIPQGAVVEADFSRGKLVYLSDLEPIGVKWTPYIGLPRSANQIRDYGLPRKDQSFRGSGLTLAAVAAGGELQLRAYRKGLAVRSRTELLYSIPRKMSRFMATVGIDPETRSQGHVTLELFADRTLIWQGAIKGGDSPKAVEASLEGARRLRILVDYGENLDFGDQLHLAEARVVK